MRIRFCELKQANEFVGRLHRHHKPVQGHRFSIRVESDSGDVLGVLIAGRPVSRFHNPSEVLEVTRVCVSEGAKNACSMLYGAAARIAREMGFLHIQTFILEEETGTTLRASGWVYESDTPGRQWVHSDGRPRRTDQPNTPKQRWGKELNVNREAKIRHHQEAYDRGEPEISDQAFDLLVAGTEPPIGSSGSSKHASPMLSLQKTYSVEGVDKWRAGVQGEVLAMPKMDGVALCLTYVDGRCTRAMTRGDGLMGEDVTNRLQAFPVMDQRFSGEIRGELILSLPNFKAVGGANPRNVTVGLLAKGDTRLLDFFVYDCRSPDVRRLSENLNALTWAFNVVPWVYVSDSQSAIDYMRLVIPDYETDGVVFAADEPNERSRLGETSHHPRWAMAYKFQGDSGITTVKEIVWQVSRFGTLTPVAVVEPVQLSGVSVTRCTLHNVEQMQKLGVVPGSKVIMTRRGGVIPHVEEVVEGEGEVLLPMACPCCGGLVGDADCGHGSPHLECINPQCPDRIVAQLDHFLKTAKVDGWGPSLLNDLVDMGITTPAELYALTEDGGWRSEAQARKLLSRLPRTMEFSTFVEALGIQGVGSTKAQTMTEFPEHPWVADLLEVVKVERPVRVQGPMTGKVVVFTGELQAFSRGRAQALVRAKGGETPSGVSKKVTHLVVGKEPGADKTSKARKLGVTEIDEQSFLEMLGPVENTVTAVDLEIEAGLLRDPAKPKQERE